MKTAFPSQIFLYYCLQYPKTSKSMPKYHYFIIPKFNPTFNLTKLKNIELAHLSYRILRYSSSHLCLLFVHTKSLMSADQVKNGFGSVPTVNSSDYISFTGKVMQTTELFIFTTIHYLKANVDLKSLLNIFTPEMPPFISELNQCFTSLKFKDVNTAVEILNYCSHIPFTDGKFIISDKSYDIPLIVIDDFPESDDFIHKLTNHEIFQHIEILNYFLEYKQDQNKRHVLLLPSCNTADDLMNQINYTKYLNKSMIICRRFIGVGERERLSYFEVKIELDSNTLDITKKRHFFLQMTEIGPVYYVDFRDNYGYVQFADNKSLPKLFLKYSTRASLARSYSITFYNFPPKTTVEKVKEYLLPFKFSPLFIIPLDAIECMLPAFEVVFRLDEFDGRNKDQMTQLMFFICSDAGVFQQRTRPFIVDTYYQDRLSQIKMLSDTPNTIQTDIVTTSINNIYKEFSRYGIIKFLYINRLRDKIFITYDQSSQCQNALKALLPKFSSASQTVEHPATVARPTVEPPKTVLKQTIQPPKTVDKPTVEHANTAVKLNIQSPKQHNSDTNNSNTQVKKSSSIKVEFNSKAKLGNSEKPKLQISFNTNSNQQKNPKKE